MPNRLLLSFVFCLSLSSGFSQNPFHSAVTLSGGIERMVYWDLIAPHVDISYGYRLGERIIVNAGLGYTNIYTNDLTNYPEVKQHLRSVEPNAQLLLSVLRTTLPFQLKLGAGFRQIITQVDYTPTIVATASDQVLSVSRARYEVNKPALDVVLQGDYWITRRLFVGLHLGYNFFEKADIQPLSMTSSQNFGPFTGTSGSTTYALPILHGLLRMGYAF